MSADFKRLSPARRIAQCMRDCKGILRFDIPLTRPSVQTCATVDRLQRWVYSTSLQVTARQGESAEAFCRRRHTDSAWACRKHGTWAMFVCKKFVQWADHVSRRSQHANPPWYCTLLPWRDHVWLLERRTNRGGTGRGTGTRMTPGRPAIRWAESVDFARTYVRTH